MFQTAGCLVTGGMYLQPHRQYGLQPNWVEINHLLHGGTRHKIYEWGPKLHRVTNQCGLFQANIKAFVTKLMIPYGCGLLLPPPSSRSGKLPCRPL